MPKIELVAGVPRHQYHDRFVDQSRACTVTVNGRSLGAYAGETLQDLLNRSGVTVPHVCYHPQLGPIRTCDTCMVMIGDRLARACATRCADGLTVTTDAPPAVAAQREAFDRILANHLLYCTVCDNNNGNCTVHNTTKSLGVTHQQIPFKPKPYDQDHSNPFYRYDPSQCILCGRCVEACQNVEVNETLSIRWEDENPRVLWDGGKPIGESSCVSCGHCVTVCPCNALMERSMLGEAGNFTFLSPGALDGMVEVVKGVEPELGYAAVLQISEIEADMRAVRTKKSKTVCTYCGVGCTFEVWTKGRHILKIAPYGGPANGISTCVKGKFAWEYTNSPDRLLKPLVRTPDGSSFREATWDEALDLVARRFTEIKERHGPDALAFVASSKTTNEEAYLMQKLARAVIGTNNIDNCSRYCQSPATQGLWRTVGYGGDSGAITDLERASLIIIVGANPAENHPVLATRIKQAQKLRGTKIVVADLRKNEMAERADVFMRPRPGTDLIWLSAITKHIIEQNWHAKEFIAKWVNQFDAYVESLAPFTLEFAEARTGIPQETLRRVAQMIRESPATCICWAMGVTQHCEGSDASTAMSNLLLATGNYMRTGTGAYPLRGHNNVQGASDFGAMPDRFPGYDLVADPEARRRFEKGWGVGLPTAKGLDNHEMVDAALRGALKSMYVKGEDMSLADSNQNVVHRAFSNLEFFVLQDCFFSDACRFADVILPASPALEKDGTFTNTERRIQRLYQVLEPLGDSRPDWRIVRDIANRLGAGWDYRHPAEIMAEAASLAPLFAGVSYERLEGWHSLCWPVREDGSDTPLLYTDRFHFPDGKARFHILQWTEPSEQQDEAFPYHLNNGRLLEHFHEGHMTYRTAVRDITPNQFLEVSPELAAELGISDGRYVQLESRHGFLRVRAIVSDRVHGHELYLPLNSTSEAVNRLTSSNTDKDSHTPAFKEVAVRLRVLDAAAETPLPRRNFRYGHRTPQDGVEVERKWKRADYRVPGVSLDGLVQIGRKNDAGGVSKRTPKPLGGGE
jgi:formate dehydrogenase major subunit